uniref:ANK_REP_REGION domain-containing protein n=1 Tax=Anisakis simplex TaxID=6269 RepID=A0A0M3JB94_ANISI
LQRRVSVSCGSDTEIEETQQDVAGSSGTNGVTSQECAENVLKAAASGDIAELSRLVAQGVDIHSTFHKTTALHTAIKNNQGVAAEFLLLNGSKVNSLDDSMNSPLHIASANAHTLIVCQLMKRGADQHLKNSNGETALDLAVEGKHADIVTL